MTALDGRIPVDDLTARSREAKPGRAARTVIAAIGMAIGWAVGMFFRSAGWLAGRAWMIAAFFAETVIYGFREGAGLPQPAPSGPAPGRPGPPGKP